MATIIANSLLFGFDFFHLYLFNFFIKTGVIITKL